MCENFVIPSRFSLFLKFRNVLFSPPLDASGNSDYGKFTLLAYCNLNFVDGFSRIIDLLIIVFTAKSVV